ncbi:hypothetical protein Sm713_54130 [Streptomyces sp. TS71-3]|nr:hypothetical protein Sm713_54130 [Streptomyces sp. TS71-3]
MGPEGARKGRGELREKPRRNSQTATDPRGQTRPYGTRPYGTRPHGPPEGAPPEDRQPRSPEARLPGAGGALSRGA